MIDACSGTERSFNFLSPHWHDFERLQAYSLGNTKGRRQVPSLPSTNFDIDDLFPSYPTARRNASSINTSAQTPTDFANLNDRRSESEGPGP
jgi:hypothetical protein